MFYSSKWQSGFFTGLITGIAIYAMAKSPKGRTVLSKMQGVTDIVKDQVNVMAQQTNDLLDTTSSVADNLTERESSVRACQTVTPGGSYSANEAYTS